MKRFFRLLGFRRRSSIKLTPKYEARRIAELRKARAMFQWAQRA